VGVAIYEIVVTMSIQQHINAWKWAVAGKPRGAWPQEIELPTEGEFREACTLLLKASKEAQAAGHKPGIGGKKKASGVRKTWLTCNGHALRVAYVPKPQAKNVRQTSIASYQEVKKTLGEKCRAVADAALAVSARCGHATDRLVGEEAGMPCALVSARRADISNAGGIVLHGRRYVVAEVGTVLDEKTNRRVNKWVLEEEVS
jgi:hypothetical protein